MRLFLVTLSALVCSTLGALAEDKEAPALPIEDAIAVQEPESSSIIPEPTATLLAGLGGLGLLFFATRRK